MIRNGVCVVGAGFSGAVIARQLAEAGHRVVLADERPHIAGNCHTERDADTGIMLHRYGPHIFHTDNEAVWRYVCTFAEMQPFRHRVMARTQGKVFALPVNLLTISQFFGRAFTPDEARDWIERVRRRDIADPANFEEQALSMLGVDLYRAFFRGYTLKQWGREPCELPAALIKRLPLRFDFNDGYFDHKYQAIPRDGYTSMIERIISHSSIELRLRQKFETMGQSFDHVVYSGPIDRYFDYALGRLEYRTLDFETIRRRGDGQGAPVVNYCDPETPWTRMTEHRHFSPWESADHDGTVLYREFSRSCGPADIPYYPVRLAEAQARLNAYVERAYAAPSVTFVGRLGTFRYIDMDVCIDEALRASAALIRCFETSSRPPVFIADPR